MAQASVQMLFSPSDEKLFFEALRAGAFDAKAVCGAVDAMRANATVEADKVMITSRIEKEVGLNSYNNQLRSFLEEQYTLAAVRGSTGRNKDSSSGNHKSTAGSFGDRRGSSGASASHCRHCTSTTAAPTSGKVLVISSTNRHRLLRQRLPLLRHRSLAYKSLAPAEPGPGFYPKIDKKSRETFSSAAPSRRSSCSA